MSHSDSAVLFEFAAWSIAVLASTAAMALSVLRPHPAATGYAARRRNRRRTPTPSLYRPEQRQVG